MQQPFDKLRQAAARITADPYRLLLLVAMIAYIIIFTTLAFDLHAGMRTHRSDLGQIAQAVWNSSQGRFVEMTDNGFIATRMTDHVEPILALISPVLWLWRDVRALLLLQVVLVGIGAWPLYELALRRLDTLLSPREHTQIWQIEPLRQMTRPLALVLGIAYLLTPHLQSALLTEFHAVPLAVPLILWAFWAVEAGRLWQFAMATLLVAATKEEMALLAAGLAAWGIWRHWLQVRATRRAVSDKQAAGTGFPLAPPLEIPSKPSRRNISQFIIPVVLLLLSLLWFYLATFVIVPAHATQVYATEQSVYFERYGALGDSPLDIAKSFVTQPQRVWQIATEPARLAYLWGLLVPFGLFSLLAPEILLLALPLLLANLLSAYPAQYYGQFHYSAPLIPYVAVSATYGLARLWRWIGHRTAGTSASYQHMAAANSGVMALVSLLMNARTALRPLIAGTLAVWLLTWAAITYLDAGQGPGAARYDPVVETVARKEHSRLLPYFVAQVPPNAAVTATAAVHPHLSLRRYVYQFPLGLSELEQAGHAEWALLDVTTNTDMAPGDLKVTVDAMLAGEWGIVDGADGFLLLHRGAPHKRIPEPFYDFARTPNPAGELSPPPATSYLHQVTVADWPRWRQTKVSAEWIVGTDVQTHEVTPSLTMVTPDGELLHNLNTAAPPALIWYPPSRWQPGERVHLTTLSLSLPTLWGVVTGNETGTGTGTGTQGVGTTAVMYSGLIMGNDQRQIVTDVFRRTAQGVVELPLPAGSPPFAAIEPLNPMTVQFPSVISPDGLNADTTAGEAAGLSLYAWGMPAKVWPGGTILVWLRWSGETWPVGKTVFVHLRVTDGDGTRNVMQRDGLPRFFVYYDAAAALAARGVIDDVRQLAIPADLPVGTKVSLVVGLYDVEDGTRAALFDMSGNLLGDEWQVAEFSIGAPPIPDQACAMVPDTCVAQYAK